MLSESQIKEAKNGGSVGLGALKVKVKTDRSQGASLPVSARALI